MENPVSLARTLHSSAVKQDQVKVLKVSLNNLNKKNYQISIEADQLKIQKYNSTFLVFKKIFK